MMNIFELTKIHKRKQQNRIKVYDEMLTNCHKKIYAISKNNISNCTYRVPLYKFGLPLYNQQACIAYIILKLRKNGFDVVFHEPNEIYISWERHKQTYYYDPSVLMLETNPDNASDILRNLNRPNEKQKLPPPKQRQQQQPQQPQLAYKPQQQSLYQQPNNQPSSLQIEYIPEGGDNNEDNQDTNGSYSVSYMTKYYKDLNNKYLLGNT